MKKDMVKSSVQISGGRPPELFEPPAPDAGAKTMTLREIAAATGAAYSTVAGYARRAGLTRNGVETRLDEKQAALITEAMKQGKSNQHDLPSSLQGVETALTPLVRVEKAAADLSNLDYESKTVLAARLLEQAVSELTRRNAALAADKAALESRLDEAEQWYSVKRVQIETGREYPWKPLKQYSAEHGYEVRKTFDANYSEVNAYHTDVWHAVYGLEL